MENDALDNLKSDWQNAAGSPNPMDKEELLLMIKKRTRSIFRNMYRNLMAEVVIGLLGLLGWGYFVSRISSDNGEAYLAAIQLTILGVLPLVWFYVAGFRHLGRGMASDSRLMPALQQTIAYWDQLLKLYFWGGATLSPAFALSAVWLVNSLTGQYLFKITEHMPWFRILGWSIFISLLAMFFVWFSIKISYGKHLKQLKESLREMEEVEFG
jgi:hypothetical protein